MIWCESIEKLGRRGLSVFCPLSLQNLYIGVFKDLGHSERSERMYGCDGILDGIEGSPYPQTDTVNL